MDKLAVLQKVDFGQSVAEQEAEKLSSYFVETSQWNKVFNGDVDIIYGPKGAGKSAIYSLIEKYEATYFQKQIALRFAENPRGATAFSDLQTDPPPDERTFVNMWKLYFLVLLGDHFQDYGTSRVGDEVLNSLKDSALLPDDRRLLAILGKVRNYISKYIHLQSIEPNASINEQTGYISKFGLKIAFSEPVEQIAKLGVKSIDSLLHKANEELLSSKFTVWFLLDRLDVAFSDNPELEENALRALFKTYLDFAVFSNFKLKIFLRSDIWTRITRTGFREATHVTKSSIIEWDRSSLLNLVIRRFLNNESILVAYSADKEQILKDIKLQEVLFYKLFPKQVDSGKNPDTFDWILGRTQDSFGLSAPRDIINLINGAIDAQIKSLEVGKDETEGQVLFSRGSLKAGLAQASKEKVEKYLLAEHPELRTYFEALRGNKSEHSVASLSRLWQCSEHEAKTIAGEIALTGFWTVEKKEDPTYWIQLIYRDGLAIVRGTAD